MRLKCGFVVLVVVIMLVFTGLFASMLTQYTQAGRIAYVSVVTDKAAFVHDENVTFKFVPLTSGVYFSTSGSNAYSDLGSYSPGGVRIIRIPDDRTPAEIINNRSLLNEIQSWDNNEVIVGFDFFNSSDGTKSLSWNGTILQVSYGQNGSVITFYKARAGHYLIYPVFRSLAGHTVKFQLDQNAIFYLDTVNLTAVPSMNGMNMNYHATITAPAFLEGNSHCRMVWSINGRNGLEGNGTGSYRAEFDLAPGESYDLVISYQDTYISTMQSFMLRGWIDTSWGNFTFQQTDWLIYGGWYDSLQYYFYS